MVRRFSETGDRLRELGNEEEAGIFEAHVEIAREPELHSEVEERVRSLESPAAVLAIGEEYAAIFAAMEDGYIAARADDVRDISNHTAAELVGRRAAGLEALETPSVILAHNLAPSETVRVPKGMALGFVHGRRLRGLSRLDHGPVDGHTGRGRRRRHAGGTPRGRNGDRERSWTSRSFGPPVGSSTSAARSSKVKEKRPARSKSGS